MKKIVTASLVAAMAISSVNASSLTDRLNDLEDEITTLKAKVKKQNTKINKVKAHDANDNIKWGADVRTAIDSINYDMADGSSHSKNDLMALRLWLNMAYAPDAKNIFKGQLSMNKAFGADINDAFFTGRSGGGFNSFDWLNNSALRDDSLHVRQAYWLYLGDKFLGANIPWTFSVGRRPSTNGFLANLSQDDAAQSPLGHLINVQFDGLSSKLDFSNITGIPGMSFKLCMGQGSTNATPRLNTPTDYANDSAQEVNDIKLGGFIFEPYNDGQYIVKTTWYRGYDVPDVKDMSNMGLGLESNGDMEGAGISVLVDGLTDEDYFSNAKVFASFAWTKTHPDSDKFMLTNPMDPTTMGQSETGTSYWFGAYLPVTDGQNDYGTLGMEYNHGSQYWRPFTYAEDTMVGSKLAARGDAYEFNYTYHFNDALSMQLRYVNIDYEYTGSNGFFGSQTGAALKIDDLKAGAAQFDQMAPSAGITPDMTQEEMVGALMGAGATQEQAVGMVMSKGFLPNVVEAAQDFRFYLRYRF